MMRKIISTAVSHGVARASSPAQGADAGPSSIDGSAVPRRDGRLGGNAPDDGPEATSSASSRFRRRGPDFGVWRSKG